MIEASLISGSERRCRSLGREASGERHQRSAYEPPSGPRTGSKGQGSSLECWRGAAGKGRVRNEGERRGRVESERKGRELKIG